MALRKTDPPYIETECQAHHVLKYRQGSGIYGYFKDHPNIDNRLLCEYRGCGIKNNHMRMVDPTIFGGRAWRDGGKALTNNHLTYANCKRSFRPIRVHEFVDG